MPSLTPGVGGGTGDLGPQPESGLCLGPGIILSTCLPDPGHMPRGPLPSLNKGAPKV